MIDYILWVGVAILQIVNIVVLIKQHKMIDELNGEIEELRDDNVWYNNRFKAVARDHANLREKIDKAIECIKNRNTTKSKKERFMSGKSTLEKVLEILEEDNSTTITIKGTDTTWFSTNNNITYTKEG